MNTLRSIRGHNVVSITTLIIWEGGCIIHHVKHTVVILVSQLCFAASFSLESVCTYFIAEESSWFDGPRHVSFSSGEDDNSIFE